MSKCISEDTKLFFPAFSFDRHSLRLCCGPCLHPSQSKVIYSPSTAPAMLVLVWFGEVSAEVTCDDDLLMRSWENVEVKIC